jgi:hypothetical protein
VAGGPGLPTGNVLDVFVPGILALRAFGAGMGAGWVVIWEMDSGVIERLRVTPASRLALLLGTVLRDVTLLSGILLPLSLGPGWLRVLGHLNPMYYAVQAARDLTAGSITAAAVGIGFAVTAAAVALALWWGTRSYHRAMVLPGRERAEVAGEFDARRNAFRRDGSAEGQPGRYDPGPHR